MKYLLLITSLLIIIGCTTTGPNLGEIRKSCKSGVAEYDDGNTNFRCFQKTERAERIEK